MSQQQTKYGQEQDKNVARKLDLDQQKQREVLKGSAGTTGTADWRSNEMKGANFQAQQQQQNILGSQQYQSDLSNIGQQKIGEFDLQSDLQQRKLAKEGELGQQNVEYSSYEQLQNLGLGQQQMSGASQLQGDYGQFKQEGVHHKFHVQDQQIFRQAPEVNLTQEEKLKQKHLAHQQQLHQQQQQHTILQDVKESIVHGYEKVRETILGQEHTAQQQFAGKASQTQIPDPNFSLHRDKKIE
eukprot:403368418